MKAKKLEVYAGKDIEEGEELAMSYLPVDGWALPRDERKNFLQQVYQFDCKCAVCVLEGSQLADSNERRLQFGDFHNALQLAVAMQYDNKALLWCKAMLRILEEEKDAGDGKKALTYRKASRICVAAGDLARGKTLTILAADAFVECYGGHIREEEHKEWDGVLELREMMCGKGVGKWKTKEKNVRGRDEAKFEGWLWAFAY
jgi:hypothetical protein